MSVSAVVALENKTEELPAGCRWTEWVNSDHPSKIDDFSSIDGKFPSHIIVRRHNGLLPNKTDHMFFIQLKMKRMKQ